MPPASPSSAVVAPVVALDIGNVCVRLDSEACASALGFRSAAQFEDEGRQLLAIGRELETSRINVDEFAAQVQRLAPGKPEPSQVIHAMHALIRDEMPGLAAFVEEARDHGLRPVFMSDITDFQYAHVRRLLSFSNRMQGAVLSYEVGDAKPNPPMYETMEREYCVGGVPALYADDRSENIAAARQRGWRSYQFGNIEGLRQEFARACEAGWETLEGS